MCAKYAVSALWTEKCACNRWACVHFEEAGFCPHREGNGFPMHAGRFIFVSTLFESCEPYSWYSTVGCEDSQHRLSKFFFLSAQWWTLIHNSRFVKIRIGHSGIFNDGTCTGRLFWIHSRNFSLVTTVNHFDDGCTKLKFLPFFLLHRSSLEVRVPLVHLGLIISTFEIALANIPRDVLVVMSTLEIALANIFRDVDVADAHQCSKVDFPYLLLFVCLLYDLLSFLFYCRLCIWNKHCWGWKIFCSYFSVSRSMRLWETDLQSLLNHTSLSIPEVRWSEQHSEFVLLSSQVHTREYLVLPGFLRFTCRILTHRYAVPRDETTCACFHLQKKLSEELSWDLFVGTNSCGKWTKSTKFRSSLQYPTNWICFCLRCFRFSPILSPHRIFLLSARKLNFSAQYDW